MTEPAVGRLERHGNLGSHFGGQRLIDVWLPPTYDGEHRFPVIYMHDGQNLFDPPLPPFCGRQR